MRWAVRTGCVFTVGLSGCAAVPPTENPALVRPSTGTEIENPILVAPGLPTPEGYRDVYERVLDALDDYFEVKPGSRYSGQIETLPRTAPGVEQPWKPGSPSSRERWLATFQSMRHYAVVHIWAGERGGYRVNVEVYKELEDLERPAQANRGAAIFREMSTVDRRVEVVGATAPANRRWIPMGRDSAFEQVILEKIQHSCR